VFEHHDVLMTPVTARPPIEVGRWEGRGAARILLGMGQVYPFTGPWNGTGQPAASVPAGFTSDGLPLSVQLIGRPNDESTLLSLAAQIEAERPWADRRPNGFVQ
jgi:amidase